MSVYKGDLKDKLSDEKEYINKINLMNETGWEIKRRDKEKALELFEKAYNMAEKINYEAGIAWSLMGIGWYKFNQNNYMDAFENLNVSIEMFRKTKDHNGVIQGHLTAAYCYYIISNFDEAIDHNLKGINIAIEINNSEKIINLLNNVAVIYSEMGRKEEELYYLNEALKYDNGSYDREIGSILSNISEWYLDNGEVNISMEYCTKALEKAKKSSETGLEGFVYKVMGKIQKKLNQLEAAEGSYLKALKCLKSSDENYYYNDTLYELSRLNFEAGKYDYALDNLKNAEKSIVEISANQLLDKVHLLQAEIYEKKLGYEKAIFHYKKHMEIVKALASEDLEKKLNKLTLDTKIIQAQKDAEIYRLKNVELKEKSAKIEETVKELNEALNVLKDTQMKLVQSEKMAVVGQMVAGVAHEINTPLATIKSNVDMEKMLLQMIHQDVSLSFNDFAENFISINDISHIALERIIEIVKSLKNFARLDEAEFKVADVHEGINNTLVILSNQLGKNITVIKDYSEIPMLLCYPQQLNQVFLNMMVNAIQAIGAEGEITVKTGYKDKRVYISFMDNGIGIPEENLSRIFDPGFTTKGVGVGTGLGLSISYNIVQKHNGKINVESKPGMGASFTVEIPVIN